MGVNLGGLVTHEVRLLEDFRGRAIAIDAYNALYQFLSIIRQPDGTPLMDRTGRVTSHLSGLFYRTSNILREGVLPVYVFDGAPHPLKRGVLEGRMRVRRRAEKEWKEAVREGDLETARTKAQQTALLTEEMIKSSTELLGLMGVPVAQALQDGEAQASYMASKGDVWATGSQDYDSLLYGCPRLVKNLAISGRRKLPRRREYVEVNIELIDLKANLENIGINREQLVDMAILMGTDFNDGIRGIGPKRALSLIQEHGDLESVMGAKDIAIEDLEEVRQIFLRPRLTDDYQLEWGEPDDEGIIELLCDEFDFSQDRVASALRKIKVGLLNREQSKLDKWF
ncbi:MAG: flap endonuclease-1 [Thermoplasmata archaeon]